nr:formin-like protein 20 [Penaeus vannamei]
MSQLQLKRLLLSLSSSAFEVANAAHDTFSDALLLLLEVVLHFLGKLSSVTCRFQSDSSPVPDSSSWAQSGFGFLSWASTGFLLQGLQSGFSRDSSPGQSDSSPVLQSGFLLLASSPGSPPGPPESGSPPSSRIPPVRIPLLGLSPPSGSSSWAPFGFLLLGLQSVLLCLGSSSDSSSGPPFLPPGLHPDSSSGPSSRIPPSGLQSGFSSGLQFGSSPGLQSDSSSWASVRFLSWASSRVPLLAFISIPPPDSSSPDSSPVLQSEFPPVRFPPGLQFGSPLGLQFGIPSWAFRISSSWASRVLGVLRLQGLQLRVSSSWASSQDSSSGLQFRIPPPGPPVPDSLLGLVHSSCGPHSGPDSSPGPPSDSLLGLQSGFPRILASIRILSWLRSQFRVPLLGLQSSDSDSSPGSWAPVRFPPGHPVPDFLLLPPVRIRPPVRFLSSQDSSSGLQSGFLLLASSRIPLLLGFQFGFSLGSVGFLSRASSPDSSSWAPPVRIPPPPPVRIPPPGLQFGSPPGLQSDSSPGLQFGSSPGPPVRILVLGLQSDSSPGSSPDSPFLGSIPDLPPPGPPASGLLLASRIWASRGLSWAPVIRFASSWASIGFSVGPPVADSPPGLQSGFPPPGPPSRIPPPGSSRDFSPSSPPPRGLQSKRIGPPVLPPGPPVRIPPPGPPSDSSSWFGPVRISSRIPPRGPSISSSGPLDQFGFLLLGRQDSSPGFLQSGFLPVASQSGSSSGPPPVPPSWPSIGFLLRPGFLPLWASSTDSSSWASSPGSSSWAPSSDSSLAASSPFPPWSQSGFLLWASRSGFLLLGSQSGSAFLLLASSRNSSSLASIRIPPSSGPPGPPVSGSSSRPPVIPPPWLQYRFLLAWGLQSGSSSWASSSAFPPGLPVQILPGLASGFLLLGLHSGSSSGPPVRFLLLGPFRIPLLGLQSGIPPPGLQFRIPPAPTRSTSWAGSFSASSTISGSSERADITTMVLMSQRVTVAVVH